MTAIQNMSGTKHTESMMYVGTTPWHGEGVYVGNKAVDAATALQASGLDWKVRVDRLALPDGRLSNKARAVVRETDGRELGIVGMNYVPFQNHEAFSFLDSLVKEGEMEYHTAGSLRNGEIVWILAKLPGSFKVLDDDITKNYVVLSNAHNGEQSLWAFSSPIRVVCCNTLALAKRGAKKTATVKIRHTGSLQSRVESARKTLGIATQTFEDYAELAQKMSQTQMERAAWDLFLDELFPGARDKKGKLHPKTQARRDEVTRLFEGGAKGSDIPGIGGTVWQALQAVTEYTNHHRPTRQKSRAESIWNGGSKKTNQFALNYLAEVTEERFEQKVMINGGRVEEKTQAALSFTSVPATEALVTLSNAPSTDRFGDLDI